MNDKDPKYVVTYNAPPNNGNARKVEIEVETVEPLHPNFLKDFMDLLEIYTDNERLKIYLGNNYWK